MQRGFYQPALKRQRWILSYPSQYRTSPLIPWYYALTTCLIAQAGVHHDNGGATAAPGFAQWCRSLCQSSAPRTSMEVEGGTFDAVFRATSSDSNGLKISSGSQSFSENRNNRKGPTRQVGMSPATKKPVRPKYVSAGTWAQEQGNDEVQGQISSVDKTRDAISRRERFRVDMSWTDQYHRMAELGEKISLPRSLPYSREELLSRKFSGPRLAVRSAHQAWMHVPTAIRMRLWKDLMLWCLQRSPRRAVQLLLSTMKGHRIRPARHVVGDCIQYLTKYYLFQVSSPDPWAVKVLLQLVVKYVADGQNSGLRQSVPNQTIYLLLRSCNDRQATALLKVLTDKYVQLHSNTVLHALSRAMDLGNVNLSLRLLKAISESGFDMDSDQVQSACVKLIRAQFNTSQQFSIRTRILTEILEMGIRPNLSFTNAILLNSIEAGYNDLAMQVYEVAKQNGFPANASTYGLLLKGAIDKYDRALYLKVAAELNKQPALFYDHSIMDTFFHAISLFNRNSLPIMLAVYRRHWNPRPLSDLGISQRTDVYHKPDPALQQNWPPLSVLRHMMCIFVRGHRDPSSLFDLYKRYHAHVNDKHAIISPLAKTDHIGNAFILAFGRRRENLTRCTMVVKDMLDDSSSQNPSSKGTEVYPQASPPTAATWSALAAVYFKHRQRHAAEKVIQLMDERGIRRERITWDTIIRGYSRLQDAEKTADAAVKMQMAGLNLDTRSMTSLRRIGDRPQLIKALTAALKSSEPELATKVSASIPQIEAATHPGVDAETNRIRGVYKPGSDGTRHDLRERYRRLVIEQEQQSV